MVQDHDEIRQALLRPRRLRKIVSNPQTVAHKLHDPRGGGRSEKRNSATRDIRAGDSSKSVKNCVLFKFESVDRIN